MSRVGWLLVSLAVVAAVGVGWASKTWWTARKADHLLSTRLAERANAAGPTVPCDDGAPGVRLRLLVLGQSNAANHGAETEAPAMGGAPMVTVFTPSGCVRTGDPLPGGTGRFRSIWSRLESALERQGVAVRVEVAMLAIDATSISDWTRESSPVPTALDELLRAMARDRFVPQMVLWQQGESDARLGTSTEAYVQGFLRLRQQLRQGGVSAPIWMALSTRCRNASGSAIAAARQVLLQAHGDLVAGPDTDAIDGIGRHRDCHFTREGLDMAALAWARALALSVPR